VIGLVLTSLALTVGIQRMVMAAPRGGSEHAALQLQAVNANGRLSTKSRLIDVSGAYPGMPATRSTFMVRNAGTMPVAFSVSAADVAATGSSSLDDVLRIAVRTSTGDLVYRGRLSRLRIQHTGILAPQTASTFTVDVTWPSSPSDAAYQGAGMSFSIVADASAA
jgi:hypothetical protein